MPDQVSPSPQTEPESMSAFDELIERAAPADPRAPFSSAFRGYDKDEVDAAVARLNVLLDAETDRTATVRARLESELQATETRHREAIEGLEEELEAAHARHREALERLEHDLTAAGAKAADAEQKVQDLSEEMVGAPGGGSEGRREFEEILRVAEDQASMIIKNATVQADRLLEAAHEEIAHRRNEAQIDAEGIRSRAEHDAQQARLRIDTEVTAHESQIEREAAHAAEKLAQAEREAATIRSEAERGAAALRSIVARETAHARGEAEEAVRALQVRALEFEESLTRRQDDAQQEFLVLHNQAVAHAERITQDANDQVAASLDHAQRVAGKADDFDRLMRAQAVQLEADAKLRAGEIVDRARTKAQKIIDTVTTHSQSVLRDAEDRTRNLRWQQHQLTSFMAEVKELIRPEAVATARAAGPSEPSEHSEQDETSEQFEPEDEHSGR
jgi:DivIVA domain-containing protein